MFDKNLTFGLALTLFGFILSLSSYFLIGNIPLTAMGIGLAIIGVSWALTPPEPLPRKVIQNLIKTSCSNIEVLLESLGVVEKAIYIPREGGDVVAYVPIRGSDGITLRDVAEVSSRFVVSRGRSLGVIINPPNVGFNNPQSVSEGSIDINNILEYALVESEIAESVKAVAEENTVVVEVKKPRIDVGYMRFQQVMGSLPASIAAQALSLVFSKPVRIEWERRSNDKLVICLRILEWIDRIST